MFYLMTHSLHLWLYGIGYMVKKEKKEIFYLMTHSIHLWLYGIGHMVKKESKEMFYLMMHSIHFIYGIWCRKYGKGPLR